MARFYAEYQCDVILQPLVGEISWSKQIVIMAKCKDTQLRQFYILATKKFGWTKDVLLNKIELQTYEKYLLGQTNFDFTELDDEHSEAELEQAIVKNIRAFLMDFGTDFSFIGNQYRIEVDGREYFIDLLLYSRRLQAMICVELKIGDFKPEYKGKIESYLN